MEEIGFEIVQKLSNYVSYTRYIEFSWTKEKYPTKIAIKLYINTTGNLVSTHIVKGIYK